ncbi:MAG: hypothetical protein ACTHLU_03110 [Novosphingobium sp.]
MNDVIGTFRVGEDLSIALDAVGDIAEVTDIAAGMKPARAMANRLVLDDVAAAIPLAVAARGAAGWTFSLPAMATASLEPGLYGIDARLTFAGGIEITENTAFIALSRAAVA